ncbi:IQ domain-containing protein H isoform X2 [Myiozetetes cayanensis]|uniref:IQ domain-containing protein H isoform X2 n=1 Tax=Myiozetetes cayanensis TaxID=478635 RepID=UPI00215F5F8F|nr:IQ domain-containing protein H isoform X2 [Myiozetetes cayanensis]
MAAPAAGRAARQVQEDLHKLKMENINLKGAVEAVDISDLRTAPERTELGLRKRAENYLSAVNGQVLPICSAGNKEVNSKEPPKWALPAGAPQEQLVLPRVAVEPGSAQMCSRSAPRVAVEPGSAQMCSRSAPRVAVEPGSAQMCSRSAPRVAVEPGSAQMCSRSAPRGSHGSQQVEMDIKIMLVPENVENKAALKHQNDETRLPLITKKRSAPLCSQKTGKGHPAATLCAFPAFPPPDSPLPQLGEDTPKGALSLTGQRLILPAAQVTLQTPPGVPKAAPSREFHRQAQKSAGGQISSRLDPGNTDPTTFPNSKEAIYGTSSSSQGNIAPPPPSSSVASTRKSKPVRTNPAQQGESEGQIPSQTQPPQAPPRQSLQDPRSDWDIVVCHGTVDQKAPGFLALKQHHPLSWGSIVAFLEHAEKLLKDSSVPLATISGTKLARVASDFELHENPPKSAILSVLKNQSAVEKILNPPGRRSRGRGGAERAAVRIQRAWRRHRAGRAGARCGQRERGAGAIDTARRCRSHTARVTHTPRAARHTHLENFCSRAKHLAANWNRIRTSRRTIIHIPSLGYSQHIREHIPDLAVQQNMQMGRLCDILDANVDVIYICPLALSEELLHYYSRLLGLQAAVRSGNPQARADLRARFRILTPEAIDSFPQHHTCLATQLKHSPRTVQMIQGLIRSRDAYVVGGVPHADELAVADMLDVPLLGPGPQLAQLYSTKSGTKRIFASAGVPTPPGEWDLHSREQVIGALSRLVVDNVEVQRWVLKMNDECGGNGTAYCDVISHLECSHWLQKEWQSHGPERWSKSQARELALVRISQELPGLLAQHVQPVNEKRFPTWEKFLQTFLTQGGVIEAFPLSGTVTNLTVDLLIEPTGDISIVSSGDQLHAEGPFRSSGTTIPQRSVDPALLNSLCWKIGAACRSKGLLGYLSVDFVAFTHPQTMEQQVWATDLDLCYSDQLALTQLVLFLTDGNLDCGSSPLEAPPGSQAVKSQRIQREGTKPPALGSPRCAVASTQLRHSNLAGTSYSLLLQSCKARGVGFDLQEKQGTVFLLYEDQKRHRLGMITIGEDLQGVLLTFARNLFIIHQEISAPNMQGETNFKMAIQDIEAILGVTAENKLKLEEEQPWEADALKE